MIFLSNLFLSIFRAPLRKGTSEPSISIFIAKGVSKPFRLTSESSETILIGGEDSYIPVCRKHYKNVN